MGMGSDCSKLFKDINPKMNVIPRLEFELALYDVTVRYVSQYLTVTTPITILNTNNLRLYQVFLCNINNLCRDARGVMVIVVGNGHGDTSSNHFT